MKYLSEFRDGNKAKQLISAISSEVKPDKTYRLMEFCGGHTHTLFRYGIPSLLPANIKLLHGPGCPVCVLPIERIDAAINLSLKQDVILCSYGDMLRVPGSHQMSLMKASAQGADIRMIYSPSECLQLATENSDKKIIFFAVGFETTTPPTANILEQAILQNINNLFIFCNHVLTAPAIKAVLATEDTILDGMIGPGHVSLITGTDIYREISDTHELPIVISGFEPLDMLQAILMLVRQINTDKHKVENQYSRAVTEAGNQKAQQLIARHFELRPDFEWRGFGRLPKSAIKIRDEFARYDAEVQFTVPESTGHDNKACECPAVLRGQKEPIECPLFNKPCTPENPLGSCMVSSEGACAAYYNYLPREGS